MFYNKTLERLNDMLDEGIAGTFTEKSYDESKLSRLEAKWKQYLEQSSLSKANLDRERENLKGLISDISHQTKTPMTNIVMYSGLLCEHLTETGDEFGVKLAEEIIRQNEKLDFLIDSLTKLSRLESNIVDVIPTENNIYELVSCAVTSVKPKADVKNITLLYDIDKSASAFFDMKWTKEAVENIIDNAVKYSPEGSCISVTLEVYEMYSEILIADEGIGISEDEIPKIFGRFYRSVDVHNEDGVGIGLFLSREIVKRENGYIKVKSEKGKGSVFSVFLKN